MTKLVAQVYTQAQSALALARSARTSKSGNGFRKVMVPQMAEAAAPTAGAIIVIWVLITLVVLCGKLRDSAAFDARDGRRRWYGG